MRNPPTPADVTFTNPEAELQAVEECPRIMALFHVPNYQVLLYRIRTRKVPYPYTTKPMQWHKGDVLRFLSQPRDVFGRRRRAS